MLTKARARNPVKSTETTFEIVHELQSTGGASVSALAKSLGLTKGTVHNHLSTLEQYGYVVRDEGEYTLGMRFFEVGQGVVQRKSITGLARPELEQLAEATGEMANLMIEEQGRGIYVDIVQSETAVNIDTDIGATQHLHTCALGKAILAHLPPRRVDRILSNHDLPRETDNTVTERQELFEEFEQIREEGIAYDGEERARGIRCIAAPVQINSGAVLGAISVTGPARRMKPDRVRNEIAEQLKDAANVIEVNASFM